MASSFKPFRPFFIAFIIISNLFFSRLVETWYENFGESGKHNSDVCTNTFQQTTKLFIIAINNIRRHKFDKLEPVVILYLPVASSSTFPFPLFIFFNFFVLSPFHTYYTLRFHYFICIIARLPFIFFI